MITHMYITYKSDEPCKTKPEIFSTGGYTACKNNITLSFDFLDMKANCRFENGYLYIDCVQKYLDKELITNMTLDEAYQMLETVTKDDFTEISYEAFIDSDCKFRIELIPQEISFDSLL